MAPKPCDDPATYLAASGISAFFCFPLWKAATIGQSKFQLKEARPLRRYVEALRPPWRGCFNVVIGMTWARAAIFYGSDTGSQWLRMRGHSPVFASMLPTTLISAGVQVLNQPFTRISVTLQDPRSTIYRTSWLPSFAMLGELLRTRGVAALWVGTWPSVLKVVPKYVMAVVVKDAMERQMPAADPVANASAAGRLRLVHSAQKSLAAGVAGALLTNPFDVLRNEMFKTEERFLSAVLRLCRTEGATWVYRGCAKNLVAAAVPISSTIFLTDALAQDS